MFNYGTIIERTSEDKIVRKRNYSLRYSFKEKHSSRLFFYVLCKLETL